MTLLGRVRSAFRASVESPTYPLTSSVLLDLFGGPRTAAGPAVTEQTSLGMPAVWRAVSLIAGTSASLPLRAYQRDNDVRLPVGSAGQSARLLTSPHPDMTPFEFWETVYTHLLLWGNAYLLIARNGNGLPVELWILHPSRVTPQRDSQTGAKRYLVDGKDHWTDTKILHIPGLGYDGVAGMSPIRLARQGIALALAAEEYGARLFGSGSMASGILSSEQKLTETQADALKARWKARVGGLEKAHDVAVLDSGLKFQQLSIPPEDAQFIESRRFQIAEVARMFGVPPHMLMDTDRSTSWGSGIEQQGIGFVVYTLRPWLTRVEQRVTRLLHPEPVYARYAVEGLLRGDSQQRAAFYTQMWGIGAFSTNDVLRLEDAPPVEGGDVRYRPLNMGILGEPDPEPVPEPEPDTDDDEEEPDDAT